MGWVYILRNKSMPGILKVGMTTRSDLSKRVKELSNSTSVPTPFTVAYKYKTNKPLQVEQKAHKNLRKRRINKRREFFKCSLLRAKLAICPMDAITLLFLQYAGFFAIGALILCGVHNHYQGLTDF